MGDVKESFKTDIGQVEVDTKKKTITVDGVPLQDVVTQKTAMELLIRDLGIDREIMTTMRSNTANMKTWLPSVGNRQAREQLRKFLDDLSEGFKAMITQRNLQMITLVKMESQWLKNQASAPSAPESKSTEDVQKTSSAPDVSAPASSEAASQ